MVRGVSVLPVELLVVVVAVLEISRRFRQVQLFLLILAFLLAPPSLEVDLMLHLPVGGELIDVVLTVLSTDKVIL